MTGYFIKELGNTEWCEKNMLLTVIFLSFSKNKKVFFEGIPNVHKIFHWKGPFHLVFHQKNCFFSQWQTRAGARRRGLHLIMGKKRRSHRRKKSGQGRLNLPPPPHSPDPSSRSGSGTASIQMEHISDDCCLLK